MFVNPPDITIFATSIINIISTSAGRELALAVQAFFMSVLKENLYRYLCTPVWNCNGTTAFVEYVIDSGKGTGTFFILKIVVCLSTNSTFLTLQCLAVSERLQLTKRALLLLNSIATNCVVTIHLLVNVAATRQSQKKCGRNWGLPLSSNARLSEKSHSQTLVFSLSDGSNWLMVAWFMQPLTRWQTLETCSSNNCGAWRLSLNSTSSFGRSDSRAFINYCSIAELTMNVGSAGMLHPKKDNHEQLSII